MLVWAGLDAARDAEEGGLLGSPEVGRLGEGTLAPVIFRRVEDFGGVKAESLSEKTRSVKPTKSSINNCKEKKQVILFSTQKNKEDC